MAALTESPLHRYLAVLSHPAFILSVANSQHPTIVWANKSFSTLIQSEFHHRALEEFVCHEAIIAGWLEAVSRHDSSKDLLVTFWTRSKGEDECIDVDCTAVRVVDTGIIITGRVLENTRRTVRSGSLNRGLDAEEGSTEILEQNAQPQPANLNRQLSAHIPIPGHPSLHEDEKLARIKEYLSGSGVTGEIILGYDWARTEMGPMTTWPQSLLICLSMALTSSFPMIIRWGPKFISFYNDRYISIAGDNHPKIMGMEGQTAWVELWDIIGPMVKGVLNGAATWSEDQLMILQRFGFREETYFTWSFSPIRQEDGSVGGVLSVIIECTNRVIAERRLNTLKELSSRTAGAKTYEQVCKLTADVLSENNADITFALIYMKEEIQGKVVEGAGGVGVAWAKGKNEGPEWEEEKEGKREQEVKLVLKECVGIDRNHPAVPKVYISGPVDKFMNPADSDPSHSFSSHSRATSISNLSSTDQSHPWPFSAVLSSCSIVNISDAHLLFSEPLPGGRWDEGTRHVVACPIVATETGGVVGVLILGCNPLKPMGENYKTFIELLSRQLSSSITTVRAYEEERHRTEALAAIDQAKTNFFSSVSHELRTPISLIMSPLEDSLSDLQTPLPSVHRSRLTIVERNAIRLLKVVNSLLDFSRIEVGRMYARYQLTDLGRLTADLASVFRSMMEKGGLEFNVDCDEGEEKVWVDRDMWEKVVYNLLSNAFKFTLHGHVHVRVRRSADLTGVEFIVEDTGTGIPSHELSKVFERFHMVEGQASRSHEGTGIGLALTYELVSLHGGKLGVRSNLGEGSTFTVFIPFGKSHLPQERLVSDDSDDNPVPSVDPYNTRSLSFAFVNEALSWIPNTESDVIPLPNHLLTENSTSLLPIGTSRVLLVDNNVDMRRYLRSLLSQFWIIQAVDDGEQAYQVAVENPPDLIISDVMIPNLDGFSLIAKLKKRKETKCIPIILLSAMAGEEARVDGLRAGADDYLIKPFSAKELVARVRTHLELGILRCDLEKRVEERTKELAESEARYRTLAKLSPVGIFRTNKEGKMTYLNDRWLEFLGYDCSADLTGDNWCENVHPEDSKLVLDEWHRALNEQEPVKVEFRSKQPPNTPEKWFLGQTIVDYNENNVMRGIIGTLTDITERKRLEREKMEAMQMGEQQQRKRAEEAEEVRRQQELFIDMTCHELRNPLNGIYNNADLIRGSLERVRLEMWTLHEMFSIEKPRLPELETVPGQKNLATAVKEVTELLVKEIENDLEAIDTITLCAKHQKVIADDVLHMSRLSLNLLVIAQVDFQPQVEIANVLRVFETEAKTKRIELRLVVEDGFKRLGVNWVRGDPTRLAQVIINFLTNAIRFTEKAPVRCITVILDVGEFYSTDSDSKLETEAGGDPMIPLPLSSDNEPGRPHPSESTSPPPPHALPPPTASSVFIHVSISDTGMGMTPAEQTQLFRRFAQASHITYSEFGGSGLGLYISKQLVELHGGSITVSSQKDGGTTFKFMIRCERSHGPEQKPEVLEKAAVQEKSPNSGSLIGKLIQHGTPEIVSHCELDDNDEPKTLKQSRRPWDGIAPSFQSIRGFEQVSPLTNRKVKKVENGEILIVEDNVVNQKVLCRQLEIEGFHCTIANHGKAALEALEASILTNSSGEQRIKYDLILMDIEMPVMSGLEAAMHIREWERNGRLPAGHIPIIAVTGNARQEHAKKALTAGMDDTIIKPYIREDLLDKIAMHTSRRTRMPVD